MQGQCITFHTNSYLTIKISMVGVGWLEFNDAFGQRSSMLDLAWYSFDFVLGVLKTCLC